MRMDACRMALTGLVAAGLLASTAAGGVQPAGEAPAAAAGQPGEMPILFGKPTVPAKQPGTIRLATYNVQNLFDDRDNPALKDVDEDLKSVKPAEQLKALADAIRRLDADVIALQEVESFDALVEFNENYLGSAKYEHVVSIDAGDQRGIENAVMSRFPLTGAQVWPGGALGGVHPPFMAERSENWWAGQPLRFWRSPLRVDVELTRPTARKGPEMMTLFVVHHRSPRFMQYWNDAEVRGVLGFVDEVRKLHPDRPIAVLGDFNDVPDSPAVKTYTEAGFTDTHAHRTPGAPEFATQDTGRVINYIMLDERLKAKVVEGSAGVLGTPVLPPGVDRQRYLPPAGYASDHFPVYVDLDLSGPEAEDEQPQAPAPAEGEEAAGAAEED